MESRNPKRSVSLFLYLPKVVFYFVVRHASHISVVPTMPEHESIVRDVCKLVFVGNKLTGQVKTAMRNADVIFKLDVLMLVIVRPVYHDLFGDCVS